MRWTLPNILSVLRLFLALLFPLIYVLWDGATAHAIALAVFVGASATDWVDGYLARRWNLATRFGAMVDPIADKAMVLIALLVVVAQFGLSPVIAVSAGIIVFREVFVSGLREFLGTAAGQLKVTKLAKWKTTVQMLAISALLAHGLVGHGAVATLGTALLVVAAALTLITGADYFLKAWPHLREETP